MFQNINYSLEKSSLYFPLASISGKKKEFHKIDTWSWLLSEVNSEMLRAKSLVRCSRTFLRAARHSIEMCLLEPTLQNFLQT